MNLILYWFGILIKNFFSHTFVALFYSDWIISGSQTQPVVIQTLQNFFLSKTSIFGDLVLHVTERMFAGKQPYVTDAFYKIIFLVILLAKILEILLSPGFFFFLNELYFTSFQTLHTGLTCHQLATRYLDLPLGVIYSRTIQFRLLTYRC